MAAGLQINRLDRLHQTGFRTPLKRLYNDKRLKSQLMKYFEVSLLESFTLKQYCTRLIK